MRKAEKAAQKRAKRHGTVLEEAAEPVPTVEASELFGLGKSSDQEPADLSQDEENTEGDREKQ